MREMWIHFILIVFNWCLFNCQMVTEISSGLLSDIDQTDLSELSNTFVASFQSNGYYSSTSYGKYKDGLNQDLWNFTLCLRLMMFHNRPTNSIISYAIKDQYGNVIDNEMWLEIDPYKDILRFTKTDEIIQIKAPYVSQFRKWKHICIVYEYATRISVYVDGKIRKSKQIKPKEETRPIYSGGILILGQDQDDYGGLFDRKQSLSGMVSEVNIWSSLLSNVTIEMYSICQFSGPVNQLGNVVAWKKEEWQFFNTELKGINKTQLCQPLKDLYEHVFFRLSSYNYHKELCTAIGGKLPVFTSQSQFEDYYSSAKDRYNYFDRTNMTKAENLCFFRSTEARFWVGRQKNLKTQKWENPYNKEELDFDGAWDGYEPSDGEDRCAHVWKTPKEGELKSWYSSNCAESSSCSICVIPRESRKKHSFQNLRLRGLCKEEIDGRTFDIKYYIFEQMRYKLHFQGIQSSHIYFDENRQWRLQSYQEPLDFAYLTQKQSTNRYPMGRQLWKINAGICGIEEGEKYLTFSACGTHEFTCDYGECIDLHQKCDLTNDCSDGSDEEYCDNIEFPPGYRKSSAPRRETGYTMFIDVLMENFPEISTVHQKYSVNFELTLRWHDNRLTFLNLKNVSNLNKIELEDQKRMWLPIIDFANAVKPEGSILDDKSRLIIDIDNDRTTKPKPRAAGFERSIEACVYDGESASIIMTRKYSTEFECLFELQYYPFDIQTCHMKFQMSGVTEKYMSFAINTFGVEYIGRKELTEFRLESFEYEVAPTTQELKSSTYSTFEIKLKLRRNSVYHILNIYLQTALLNMTACLTLFFDVTKFNERITVTLTVMLVVATLMSNVQKNLPPTAYYKLIDVWLLVTLNIMIVIIIQHTILAYKLKLEEKSIEYTSSYVQSRKNMPKKREAKSIDEHFEECADKDFPKTRKLNETLRIIVFSCIGFFFLLYLIICLYAEFCVE